VKLPERRPLTPDETFTVDDSWRTIEEAWDRTAPWINKARRNLILSGIMKGVLPGNMRVRLKKILAKFSPARLAQWEINLTRLLYDLDIERIHRAVGGDSESFLHKRAWVVALGKTFYDAVLAEPNIFRLNVVPYDHFLSVGLEAYSETFGHELSERWNVASIGASRTSFSNEDAYSAAYFDEVIHGSSDTDDSEPENFRDEDCTERRLVYSVVYKARIAEDAEVTTSIFWDSWPQAWKGIGVHHDFPHRSQLYRSNTPTNDRQSVANELPVDRMMAVLRRILEGYTATQLQSWHNHLNLMLYNLDREDLYSSLGAKDSTFLGYRFFIVACGQEYYDNVQRDPAKYATRRCVDYSWIAADVARTKHGQVYDEIIPLAARSNKAGWPTKHKK